MLRLIHRTGPCENGPCPNVFDVAGDGRDGMVAVQGATMTEVGAPASLSAVRVPRQLVLDYAALFPAGAVAGTSPDEGRFGVSSDRDGMTVVTGETMTDASALAQLSGMPPHESVVLVPRQLVLEHAGRIRKEGTVVA